MDRRQIFALELAYETRDWEKVPESHREFFQKFVDRDFPFVFKFVEENFMRARGSEEKAFLLQWGVAAAEISADHKARRHWLEKWTELEDWAEHDYCRFLRSYHDGVSAFVQPSLTDSERHFQNCLEIALELGYERGVMRALFHLGLVFRDRGLQEQCAEYLRLAFERATGSGANAFAERVNGELAGIGLAAGNGKTVPHFMAEVERCLREKNVPGARAAFRMAEKHRRKEQIGRGFYRLAVYLPPLAAARGRFAVAERAMRTLRDPILRIKALTFWNEVGELKDAYRRELDVLRETYGISKHVERFSSDPLDARVCGKRLGDVKDESVRKLIAALLGSAAACSKAEICRAVWGLEYDPVLHDNKIYKLFHKARKIFGQPDLLENHYGAYSLNAHALGKKRTSKAS